MTPQAVKNPPLTVYYDGACPVCAREIGAYRRLRGGEAISWVDAASCGEAELGGGLARDVALARLHARRADGSLVDGAAAFAEMWQRLPALSRLGRFAALPLVRPVLEGAYRAFLVARRLWRAPAPRRR